MNEMIYHGQALRLALIVLTTLVIHIGSRPCTVKGSPGFLARETWQPATGSGEIVCRFRHTCVPCAGIFMYDDTICLPTIHPNLRSYVNLQHGILASGLPYPDTSSIHQHVEDQIISSRRDVRGLFMSCVTALRLLTIT